VHGSGEPSIVLIGVASAGISSAGSKTSGVNTTSRRAILLLDRLTAETSVMYNLVLEKVSNT
jgi:hypothetical protein